MRSRNVTIWVITVILCLAVSPLWALTEFKDGQVHNINYEIDDMVRVDYEVPGMETTVNLLPAGYIRYDLKGYEDSRLNISGGSIGEYLRAYGSSQVTVSEGAIGKSVWAYHNSQVSISGGEMFGLKSYHNSQVTVSGGEIGYSLWANNNSYVTMSGGDIRYWLGALDNSQMTVSGGKIGYGVYAGCPPAWDTSIITFEGTDFAINGNPVIYGDFASDYAVPGTAPGGDSCLTGRLTGILADGSILNNRFYIFDDADITFAIPEPGTVLLLGLGGLAVLRKRKS